MPATATPGLRDRLKHVEERVDELRDEIKAAEAEELAAQQTYATKAGEQGYKPGSKEFAEAKEATRVVGTLRDELAEMQGEKEYILAQLGRQPSREARDAPASVLGREPQGWNADSVLSVDGVEEMLAQIAGSAAAFGSVRLGEVIGRDDFAADIAPTANMRRGNYYGVLPQIQRPLTLLDLIPSAPMTGSNIPYTRESGNFTGAAETAEGAEKPEAGVTYTDDESIARVVAAWMKLPKPALADVPALRGIIDQRLRYLVLRRLEGQILSGNGTAPNLRGILNTSGIGTVAWNAGDPQLVADQILDGITTVLLADAMADGVVAHPLDWAGILKAKAAGDGHYYSGGPFSMTPQVIWGVPLLPSLAMPVGHALPGDFSIGVQLFVRQGIEVLFSDSDGTDFRENRVTLLGEGRFALPVWRPSAFVDTDISAS
jgi:hypothetical protein